MELPERQKYSSSLNLVIFDTRPVLVLTTASLAESSVLPILCGLGVFFSLSNIAFIKH